MEARLPRIELAAVLRQTLEFYTERDLVEALVGFIWEEMTEDANQHMMRTLRKWHSLNGEVWPPAEPHP